MSPRLFLLAALALLALLALSAAPAPAAGDLLAGGKLASLRALATSAAVGDRCGANKAGTCRDKSKSTCDGTWQSGQCSGSASVVCCLPKASAAAPAPAPAAPAPAAASAKVNAFISCLRSKLGKPYVYGAAGPDGFDCSGLTMTCARAAGVTLPRVSRDQAATGRAVTLAQLQPGDLAFFAKPGKPVHHVSAYIGRGANGAYQYIEAPYTGLNVRVRENMHSQRSDFKAFRRIF